MERIRELKHPHLIDVIATFKRGDRSYFIFPWADRGNLREFWRQEISGSKKYRDAKTLGWVLEQLRGLSDAISKLHQKNCRHGDLKPENILLFDENQDHGRLVIADVGLAKFHSVNTGLRQEVTTTMIGTQKYEPPDVLNEEARSRVYDMWSIGCICLEFVIWFVWGPIILRSFNESSNRFWQPDDHAPGLTKARVHDEIAGAIRWMMTRDPRCRQGTALGDLLALVEKRLLVIDVQRDDLASPNLFRAKADEFLRELDKICHNGDQKYFLSCVQPQGQLTFLDRGRFVTQDRVKKPGAQSLAVPGSGKASPQNHRLAAGNPGSNPWIRVQGTVSHIFNPSVVFYTIACILLP